MPAATIDGLGLIRTGPKDIVCPGHDELRNVFLDDGNGLDDHSRAKVNVMTEGSLQAQRFFTQIDAEASETIDVAKTIALAEDNAVEVDENEEAFSIAGQAVKKSKLGQWKWTLKFLDDELDGRVFAVYASYHGHSDVDLQHGVQIIV